MLRIVVQPALLIDPAFPGVAPEVVEAYRSAPDNVSAEILDGELSLMPRPRPQHARTATRLAGVLRGFHDPEEGEPGGWVVLVEPELQGSLQRLRAHRARGARGWEGAVSALHGSEAVR